jgi:3-isopropylmalate dehydrogenase
MAVMLTSRILALGGDGIGPEVLDCALEVLTAVAARAGISVTVEHDLLGGASWDRYGTMCRDEVVAKAKSADAVLVGAVGGPKWDGIDVPGGPTDKDGLVRLRKEMDVFACLRPSRSYSRLLDRTPFRPELVDGTDIIVLRELCGGIYFGEPRGIQLNKQGEREGFDSNRYTEQEIRRVVQVGFELARGRRKHLTSVDKANVMESGVLWRLVTDEVAQRYPDVALQHLYADNGLFQMARNPRDFDVIVGDNLFGDLFSDLAATFAGSLGMLPSASLSRLAPAGESCGPGIYEAVHGSAPDIAGRGIANPVGTILSVAMLYNYALGRPDLAGMIEGAVSSVLEAGVFTADLGGTATSCDMTRAILDALP